jgi:hypothetical protein
MMKGSLILSGILLLSGLVYARAVTKNEEKKESYQPGTVLSVDKHVAQTYYVGSPIDAPLQPNYYSYDVGIRVNCTTYVGRYDSAINYLPSSFAPNHPVQVLLHKHTLTVWMPELGREVEMRIVGHKRVNDEACHVNG